MNLKIVALAAALALLTVAAPASATVLTDGSGAQLKTGTNLTLESEEGAAFRMPVGSWECENFQLEAKTSNSGSKGANVNANVEALTWSGCNGTYTVLKKGTLSIAWTSGNEGTLTSTGTEVTYQFASTGGFPLHCKYGTNNTKLGTITGSTITGGNATLDIEEVSIPRTGGENGFLCGAAAEWTGASIFTAPAAMNLDEGESEPESTLLTDGSGTQLKSGTVLTAESESTATLHLPSSEVNCESSHFGGKTTSNGGGGASAIAENSTWSKCNATLTVLAKGTLAIKATGGGSAELTSTGTELTVVSGGLHCVVKTSNTKLGTITGSAITKGNATLDIEASLPRTGGSSGALCGSTAQWTGSYGFTSPGTMNID